MLLVLANLVLVVAAFVLVAQYYYGIDISTLLFAPATDRVVAVARQVSLELEHTSLDEQTTLMGRYAATYGADFYLFRNTGTQQAGRAVTLPSEIVEELNRRPGDRGKAGRRPPQEPRWLRNQPAPNSQSPDDAPPPRPGRGRYGPPGEDGAGRGPSLPTIWNRDGTPVFQVSAGDRYWVGIRMPLPDRYGDRPLPGSLLISAKSFYGTPLVFDLKPWLAAMLAVITIFAICWLPFIRSLTRSISQLTRATERISQGDFELHLKEGRGDELGQLASAINRMTRRLAGFVTGQKRFLGDIAHELCAPLARIQFGLGILEQRTAEEHLGAVTEVQDEVRQMSELLSELLTFSKAGMEAARRPLRDVDVGQAVRLAVAREATGQDVVRVECEEPVFAQADESMLVRAVSNVVRNAIRYAGADGPVSIHCGQQAGLATIVIRDSGPGLKLEDLDRVFAPFYRPEVSRNRASGGAGLGLAIVRSCVEACQGTVQCRNRAEGGLKVEIQLKAGVGTAGGAQ